MKKILTILALLLLSSYTFAIGGVWVLEIEYSVNGKGQIGYIVDEDWTEGFETFIGKDSLFNIKFRRKFENSDSLKVYEKIIDQEKLSEIADFPMHPFFLVEKSKKYVLLDEIERVSLIKVWKKIDYTVNVLTKITIADTSWIKENNSKEYPIGDDVGCRLEVYNFGDGKSYKLLLSEFSNLYLKKEKLTLEERKRYNELLKKLKEFKVIVVELCGC